jgi:ABC-2 type transport system ATP-binding protein
VAYDERLADRVREVLGMRDAITERKMFAEAERVLASELGPVQLEADPAALAAPCAEAARAADAVAALSRSGVRIADFSLGQPSLDEVFLALTGHPAVEGPEEETAVQEERAA